LIRWEPTGQLMRTKSRSSIYARKEISGTMIVTALTLWDPNLPDIIFLPVL
jgi:hypothetical protein